MGSEGCAACKGPTAQRVAPAKQARVGADPRRRAATAFQALLSSPALSWPLFARPVRGPRFSSGLYQPASPACAAALPPMLNLACSALLASTTGRRLQPEARPCGQRRRGPPAPARHRRAARAGAEAGVSLRCVRRWSQAARAVSHLTEQLHESGHCKRFGHPAVPATTPDVEPLA